MTQITQTKLNRAIFQQTINPLNGKIENTKKILGFRPAQPRDIVTCKAKGCGRQKLLSVGQIWVCHHKDKK